MNLAFFITLAALISLAVYSLDPVQQHYSDAQPLNILGVL